MESTGIGKAPLLASTTSPSPCCPPGALPIMIVRDYVEQGTRMTLGGTEVYVARPSSAPVRAGVILLHDIFGMESGRHRALCDQLAAEIPGLLVVMPDVLGDDLLVNAGSVSNGIGIGLMCKMLCSVLAKFMCCDCGGFLRRQSWNSKQRELLMNHIVPMLREAGAAKIGTVGFCFGTYGVFHASSTGDIDCGVSFHPAVEMMTRHMGDADNDIILCGRIRCQQMVVHTSGDAPTWAPGGAAQEAADAAKPGNLWLSTPQAHGFMSRGDVSDPSTKEAVQAHFDLLKNFLREHLDLK